jgi:hypothetical protein
MLLYCTAGCPSLQVIHKGKSKKFGGPIFPCYTNFMREPRISSSLDLQPRDLALLRGLFECRIMTAAHVAALHFDDKREYAKKRLQKLKAAGLIGERKRRVNEPSVLFLTRKAFLLLSRDGHLSGFPQLSATSFENRANVREITIRHELEVMDVKAAFHAALLGSEKFLIQEFTTWPLLNQFETTRNDYGTGGLLKPDGFIRIHERDTGKTGFVHDCFLEVDRSSEVQGALVGKATDYLNYYGSGGFAVRNGGTIVDKKSFPFRVLIVLKTAERRNNTAERLLRITPPILTLTWLTTLAEVTTDPLGPIWIQPKSYRDVTADTPFDTERKLPTGFYRRQSERETFVEGRIVKRRLLED